ncbi:hypothetical protein B0A52_06708 [Exophiala mesophila]|uniref:Uncharacterized protein n=1 Tax=Exophiala mesophila TaxID=212818 RepID=A0A438N1W9_EXOME|nr:hypothetical protein B0A52_06708 [Exophiala mesophila]
MPEVVRGSRATLEIDRNTDGPPSSPITSPTGEGRNVHFSPDAGISPLQAPPPLATVRTDSGLSLTGRRKSSPHRRERRRSDENEPEQDAYYDSRAATKREFKRRASTLQQYYDNHPDLLPQLPFTWRRGWKRWKLFLTIFLMVVDACVVPIVLYYTMTFAGHVEGWIVFAVVATIWGGPAYVEFAVRSFRLIKKENFFRPLGTNNRWAFDITHWILSLTIAAITAFLIIGSAPHIVWLRVLSMPGPAILYCLGGPILLITAYSELKRPAPFRISSTSKGGEVYPGVYYLVEDVVAVNAGAGRPFREALEARYKASPRFRRMLRVQSWFWSVPAIMVAIVCTVLIVIHRIPKAVAFGWGVPFVWAGIWAAITIPWMKREMVCERETWEMDFGISPSEKKLSRQAYPVADPTSIPVRNGDVAAKDPRSDSEDTNINPPLAKKDSPVESDRPES